MGRVAGSCFVAALFSILGGILELTVFRKFSQKSNQLSNFDEYKEMDTELIEEDWKLRRDLQPLAIVSGFVNVLAWVTFCIPLLQTAWKLSMGGKRLVGLHSSIGVLAMAASMIELLSTLLATGSSTAMIWMSTEFNLDRWLDSNKEDDHIGWRVLEVTAVAIHGIFLWVDAIEVLFAATILVLLFVSIQRQVNIQFVRAGDDEAQPLSSSSGRPKHPRPFLSRNFGGYCLVLSWISLVEFAVEVLRLESWIPYTEVATVVKLVSRFLFWPLWFLWLGEQLARNRRTSSSVPFSTAETVVLSNKQGTVSDPEKQSHLNIKDAAEHVV